MFEILSKYNHNGRFDFRPNDDLSQVCNAPIDKSGVYMVWDTKNPSNKELIYIGRSGIKKGGIIHHRKDGIFGRIVKGYQFGRTPRRKSWPKKMKDIEIFVITVSWYNTEQDNPEEIEDKLLSEHIYYFNGKKPKWNKRNPRRLYTIEEIYLDYINIHTC